MTAIEPTEGTTAEETGEASHLEQSDEVLELEGDYDL